MEIGELLVVLWNKITTAAYFIHFPFFHQRLLLPYYFVERVIDMTGIDGRWWCHQRWFISNMWLMSAFWSSAAKLKSHTANARPRRHSIDLMVVIMITYEVDWLFWSSLAAGCHSCQRLVLCFRFFFRCGNGISGPTGDLSYVVQRWFLPVNELFIEEAFKKVSTDTSINISNYSAYVASTVWYSAVQHVLHLDSIDLSVDEFEWIA